jgi:tetratricopeptide (TPR) repeat protein
LYEQALQLYPTDFEALIGLGDCKETLTGDPKAAIPYYRKALFDSTTGDFRKNTYFNDTTLLTAALLFQRASEMPEALKLYNRAAKQMRYWPHKTTLQHPVPLPYLTSDASPLDLSALIHVGLGLDSEGHGLQTEQADFESAAAIKDTPISRFYLEKFKKEHPNLYKDGKPVQAVQPSK